MKFTTGHDVDNDGEKDIYLHHHVSDQEVAEIATLMGRTHEGLDAASLAD